MPELNMRIDMDEALLDAALRSILAGEAEPIRPAKVTVSAPYASSLEFGSEPAVNAGPKTIRPFRREDGSLFYQEASDSFWNIYQWATRHPGKLPAYRFAQNVYEKIMGSGMDPHPFVRPALYDFESRFGEIFSQKGSLLGAAEVLADMIKDNLNGSAPGAPTNDLGVLRDSIEASYDDDGEGEDYPSRDIWDIPDGDINGNSKGGRE